MQNTIVAVYDSFEHARDAMTALLDHGFDRGSVQLNPHADATGVQRASSVAEQPGTSAEGPASGIVRFFRSLLGTRERHAHEDMYVEAIRRGSSVLTVVAGSDRRRDEAIAILMRFHPVDMDRRVEHWRREGWSGYVGHISPDSPEGTAASARPAGDAYAGGAETPLPPQGSVGQGDAAYPRYGLVRVYEGGSAEAVQHGAAPARRNADYDDTLAAADDADYRNHWSNVYGTSGERYEDFDAAYRYGAVAMQRRGMQDARWEEAEPDLRGDWEAQHPERPWERVREAVRYGAEKATDGRRRQ